MINFALSYIISIFTVFLTLILTAFFSKTVVVIIVIFVSYLLNISVGILMYSALVISIVTKDTSQAVPISKQLQYIFQRFIPVFITLYLYSFICMFGMILLIIPGLIFTIKYSQSLFFALVGGEGPIKSLKSSARITHGKYLHLMGLNLILTMLIGVLLLPPVFISIQFFSQFQSLITVILTSLSGTILTMFQYAIWKFLTQHT
ncbi:MAG: hypothetical protein WCT34_03945 [Patescibacteria group bacterium]